MRPLKRVIFLPNQIIGKRSNAIASIHMKSCCRMCVSTSSGQRIAVTPKTPEILKMFEPIRLPRLISVCLRKAAIPLATYHVSRHTMTAGQGVHADS